MWNRPTGIPDPVPKRRWKMFWRLLVPFLIVMMAASTVAALLAARSFLNFREKEERDQLTREASLIANLITMSPDVEMSSVCGGNTGLLETRVTLIAPDGTVVCDTSGDATHMSNHVDRPEVQAALKGQTGLDRRWSATLGNEMIYAALPNSNPHLIVRTARTVDSIDRSASSFYTSLSLAALATILLLAAVMFWFLRRVTRPMEDLEHAAERLARGDLSVRITSSASREVRSLAAAMNSMAENLQMRFNTIERQRSELRAIFTSMLEAVIVIEPDGRVSGCNQAACDLFGYASPIDMEGANLHSVTNNTDLVEVVCKTLDSASVIDSDITMDDRYLVVHGSPIVEPNTRKIGALIVLNDITRIKRLEDLRKEFAANVSHELKTPVTAIQGFVETLCDEDVDDPETVKRFLSIISTHVYRLKRIIDDLLTLSRLEHGTEEYASELAEGPVGQVVSSAIEICRPKANAGSIKLESVIAGDTVARINPPLLEQAVINLLDNAIKYSPADSTVTVSCRSLDNALLLEVTDQGCGIPPEHLPRLFERFYRVDKARSRKLGGTGLGLAIVKHIAALHRGTVSVESKPGHGSRFIIRLPLDVHHAEASV